MGWNVKNIFHALVFLLFVISVGAQEAPRFTPSAYKIHIETEKNHFFQNDSDTDRFKGEVTITIRNSKLAKEALGIVLDTNPASEEVSVTLKPKGGQAKVINCTSEIKKNKLHIKCPEDAGNIQDFDLTVRYKNPFGSNMNGLYRSAYVDSEKTKRWLIATHFEPVYARDAFPCFDRPDLKAKFTFSIKVPKEITTVLSNTEQDGQPEESDGFKTYKFKETNIPMSTYLVAFTASIFKSTPPAEFTSNYNSPLGPKKILRTYGRVDKIEEDGKFAQEAGKAALEALTNYLDQGYALNKVDQVGIPDFSAGAMENFGHISFREKSLFVNKDSSTMTKQSNLLTIVHELVHQWFGNLVTLENWNYIWLNEAFANYLEYVIAAKFTAAQQNIDAKNWKLMEQLVVNEIHSRAFETDGLTSSKPLTHNITDESLILPAFNDIPYSKGAAVLRMWDLSLGASKFQESLKKYIKDRAEKSANPDQLYDAFKNVARMSESYFKTWTEQVGYPVVDVQKTGNETYKLTQSRFTWEESNGTESWEIPITYFTKEKKEENVAFLKGKDSMELKNVKGKWIVVNRNQMGYYRVNYNTENWEALSKALNESNYSDIPELNRAQIINDIFSLARSVQKNYVNYSTAFDLARYLRNETEFIPWKTALNSLDFVANKVRKNDVTFDHFKSYVLEMIKPHFKNLNSTEETHIDRLKKVEFARWACSLDFEPCVQQAKELYKSNNYNNYPDIREILLCTVVRTNKTVWEDIFKKYREENDSSLKVMYLLALGCTPDSNKAKEYLERTLKDGFGIRKQDLMFVLSSVYNGNVKNLDVAFNFVENNFVEIAKKYGGINPLGKAIIGIARKLDTEAQCKRLEALVKKVKENKEVKGADESLHDAVKIANANCDWGRKKLSQLNRYFNGASSFASSLSLLFLCLFFVFRL